MVSMDALARPCQLAGHGQGQVSSNLDWSVQLEGVPTTLFSEALKGPNGPFDDDTAQPATEDQHVGSDSRYQKGDKGWKEIRPGGSVPWFRGGQAMPLCPCYNSELFPFKKKQCSCPPGTVTRSSLPGQVRGGRPLLRLLPPFFLSDNLPVPKPSLPALSLPK